MKSLLTRFLNTPASLPPSPPDEEIPRYPPFAKGLPAASVTRILATQAELTDSIRHTLALPERDFRTIVLPVIERYAAFTHLLPASEAHHHRGAGGLFRHGLEVACWAALAAEGIVFGAGTTPRERKDLEPRWRLAVCLAGLLHDIGKPVSDLCILDRDGRTQWNPYLENLTDWAAKNGVDRYFLRWRDKRHQRHEQFSVLVAERVLTPECLSYLTHSGPDIMQAMLEAIAGVEHGGVLPTLVLDADRKSVERDLRANHIPADAGLGVPVEKYLLDAMRRLVREGRWTANQRGARVWRFAEGLHVVWKTAAQEICELLARDKVPGIPRDPETLADILIERNLAIPRTTAEGRAYRYWRMAPAELDMALYMLRLASPDLIYSGEPPVIVEGRWLDETETDVTERGTPASDSKPAHDRTPLLPIPPSVRPGRRSDAAGEDSPPSATNVDPTDRLMQPIAANAESPQPGTPDASRNPAASAGKSGARHKPSKVETVGNPKSNPDGQAAPSGPSDVQANPVHVSAGQDNHPSDLQAEAEHWLASHGKSGEWLRAAIAACRETSEVAVRVVNGSVFLPHPDVARQLGRDPGETLRLLDAAGWIETDLRAPLRKVQEIDGVRGILLSHEASRCWVALADGTGVTDGSSVKKGEGAANTTARSQADLDAKSAATPTELPRVAPPREAPTQPAPGQHIQPVPADHAKPPTLPKTATAGAPIPLGEQSEPGSAEDLIRRIRERQGVPRPITETAEWLSVPNTVLDWYVALHPGLTRSRLVVALHRHPGVQLQGNTLLIPRLEA